MKPLNVVVLSCVSRWIPGVCRPTCCVYTCALANYSHFPTCILKVKNVVGSLVRVALKSFYWIFVEGPNSLLLREPATNLQVGLKKMSFLLIYRTFFFWYSLGLHLMWVYRILNIFINSTSISAGVNCKWWKKWLHSHLTPCRGGCAESYLIRDNMVVIRHLSCQACRVKKKHWTTIALSMW